VSYISPLHQGSHHGNGTSSVTAVRPAPRGGDIAHFTSQWYLIAEAIRLAATHNPMSQAIALGKFFAHLALLHMIHSFSVLCQCAI
jgi:hypothetical protein